MNETQKKRVSKFLSLVLRHKPETIGIELGDAGWVDVDSLLAKLTEVKRTIDRKTLELVVNTNDKQRFQFSEDGTQIRATQGHSLKVDLGYDAAEPPESLFHGTPQQFVDAIRKEGLSKQQRHHVHLHADGELASSVGQRRGKPVLLVVESMRMYEAGLEFFVTPNDVWLTDHVPPQFIRFPATESEDSE